MPVLWDKKEGTIVNNESAEIVRMFNSSFNEFAKKPDLDLCAPQRPCSDVACMCCKCHHSMRATLPADGRLGQQSRHLQACDACKASHMCETVSRSQHVSLAQAEPCEA